MSWDLSAYRLSENNDEESTREPLGEFTQLKSQIESQLDVEWLGSFYCAHKGDGYYIEINIGDFDTKEGDIIDGIDFEVRGAGDPLPILVDFCNRNKLVLLDYTTGEYINLDNPSNEGWKTFQHARDIGINIVKKKYGIDGTKSNDSPLNYEDACEKAKKSGYLRDQPIRHMRFSSSDQSKNFVAWYEQYLYVTTATPEIVKRIKEQIDSRGYFYTPEEITKSSAFGVMFKNVSKITDYIGQNYIRIYGVDGGGVRRRSKANFENEEIKNEFLNNILPLVGIYSKTEREAASFIDLMKIPFFISAIVIVSSYLIISTSTANIVTAIVATVIILNSIAILRAKKQYVIDYEFNEEP